MKINFLYLFYAIIIISTYGCVGHQQESELKNEAPKYIIQVDLDKAQKDIKYTDFIEEYDLVRLETDSNASIGKIDKLLVIDDHIWILDRLSSKGVFKFSRSGEFITQIGSLGPNPGQYTVPTDFAYNQEKNEIIVVDNAGKLIHYSLDGSLIKESYPSGYMVMAMNSLSGNTGYAFRVGGQNSCLTITDADLNVKEKYFPFLNPYVNSLLPNILQTNYEDKTLYKRHLIDSVYHITSEGVKPYIAFDFLEYTAPYEEFSKPDLNEDDLVHYFNLYDYFELANHITFNGTCKGVTYSGIFNKEQNKVFVYAHNKVLNDITFENNSNIVGIDPSTNALIYNVETNYMKRGIKASESAFSNLANWKKASALAEQTTNRDNPILLFAKLKDS